MEWRFHDDGYFSPPLSPKVHVDHGNAHGAALQFLLVTDIRGVRGYLDFNCDSNRKKVYSIHRGAKTLFSYTRKMVHTYSTMYKIFAKPFLTLIGASASMISCKPV